MEKTARSLKEILNGFDRAVNVGFIILSHGQHIGKFREVGSGRLTSASPVPELSNFFPRPIWGLNPGGRKEEIFILFVAYNNFCTYINPLILPTVSVKIWKPSY